MLVKLQQTGDTIVEVLIVLAVLGFAISISYATANRSLLQARAAQESSEAAKLLQSQLEIMRSYAGDSSDPAKNIFISDPFCIDASNTVHKLSAPPAGACNFGTEGRYAVEITWAGPSADSFLLEATWDEVGGSGTAGTKLNYRIHKP